jgi:hypothetical protein
MKEMSPSHPTVTESQGILFFDPHFLADRKTMRNYSVKAGDGLAKLVCLGKRREFCHILSVYDLSRSNYPGI